MRLALLLGVLLWSAPGVSAQAPPREGPGASGELADLVNAMLGALMGDVEVTGEQLQEEVAEAGGIPFRRDVPMAFMGHDELAAYLAEVVDDEYPREQAEADERLLRAFDLLDEETDLRALRTRLLEENVVGFYDERPGRQQLFAVSEDQAFTPMNQIVLVHELRHALQDQYEDLHHHLPEDVGDFDDRRLAWISLLEGDATLIMERFLLVRLGGLGLAGAGELGSSELPLAGLTEIPGAPRVVQDHLVMPYLVGRELARAIEEREGADGMREAWRRPPGSTEQVLHPEKYFDREPPRVVIPRRSPGRGRLLSQGVFGELLLRSLLEEGGEAPGAAGWGGDAWRLWDVEGATALCWTSAWDTPADALEFEEALRSRFARRHVSSFRGPNRPAAGSLGQGHDSAMAIVSLAGEWSVFESAEGWRFGVRREVDGVELVSSDDGEVFAALLR